MIRICTFLLLGFFWGSSYNAVAQDSSDIIGQDGVAVRLLQEKGQLGCIGNVKSFERFLALSANQIGYGIFAKEADRRPNENIMSLSISSFLDDDRMHSTLISTPNVARCSLYGHRILVLKDSCKNSLNKRERFRGYTYSKDESGVLVIRDKVSANKGFMIGADSKACLYIEPLSKTPTNDGIPTEVVDVDKCSGALNDFKNRAVNRGVDYSLTSKSSVDKAGVMTQRGSGGSEYIFYVASPNGGGVCEVAANQIRLFSQACGVIKDSSQEFRDLNVKAQSKNGSMLLDAGPDMEIEMSDIATSTCMISINKIIFK